MKVLAITLALAGLASTATLNAQIVSNSRVTGTTQGVSVNGSWTIVGRDGNGKIPNDRWSVQRKGEIQSVDFNRVRNRIFSPLCGFRFYQL